MSFWASPGVAHNGQKRASSDYEFRGDSSLIFATSRDGPVDLPARVNHPVKGLKHSPLLNPSVLS